MNQLFPYAGSSKKTSGLISEIFRREGFNAYAEPMCGSASVFFELRPDAAYLSDIEWYNTNLLQHIKDDPVGLCQRLQELVPEKEEFIAWQERIGDSSLLDSAGVWFFLLTTCYNGVVKKKEGRPYLTPGTRLGTWGVDLQRKYIPLLHQASAPLQAADIFHCSYEHLPPADVAFFDPPWFDSDEDYGVDFSHRDLAEYLGEYPGKFLLTINDCEKARSTYLPFAEWMLELEPYYSVAPVKKGRKKRPELLLSNFSPVMFPHG